MRNKGLILQTSCLAQLALVLALLPGCRRGGADGFVTQSPDGAICLAVGATADLEKPVNDFKLEDYFEPFGEILPSDDPRTFMRSMNFSYADEESVLAYSADRVVRLSLKDGSFICEYGRKGRGPGEYVQALLCFVQDGEVYVSDTMSQVHVYALEDGRLLREIPLFEKTSQFSTYAPLDKDHGLICYSSLAGKDHLFDVVDASRQVTRAGTLSMEKPSSGGIRLGVVLRMDGSMCAPLVDSDMVLYKITAEKDTPWVRLDRGMYPTPSSNSNHWLIADSFMAFGPFFYTEIRRNDEDSSMALYNLKRRSLVLYKTRSKDTYREYGLPYSHDGQTQYLVPTFADRDLLICQDNDFTGNYRCFRLRK